MMNMGTITMCLHRGLIIHMFRVKCNTTRLSRHPYCNWMIKKLDGRMPFEYSRLHWSRLCRLPRFASCKSQFEFCLKIQYFQIWSVFECCKNASHVIILRKVYNGSTKIFRGNFRFQNFCFKRDSKMLLYFTF